MDLARRFSFWASIAIAFACLVPAAAAQTAQHMPDGVQGMLASVAYDAVAPGLAIDVKSFDDSELAQALRQRFEAELQHTGHPAASPVASPAGLSLAFETKVVPGRFSERERTLGRVEAGSRGTDVQINLWSSSDDSLLGGQRSDGRREANVLHMNVVLRDLGSGKVLWQADAYGELVAGDLQRVGLAMVGPIVARIGQTVTEERFALE